MRNRFFLAFFLFCLSLVGVSAQNYVVSGRATDGKDPLPHANVLMENVADTLQRHRTVTDEKGTFGIEVAKGTWLLRITYLGYTPYETKVNVTENMLLPDLKLDKQSVMLKGATVIGRSTVFDASGYTVNLQSNPMLRELKMDKALLLLPGVFGNDNSLKVYDKSTSIYLDGIFVPLEYINNLDADQIEKIEVVVNAGVSEDAASMQGAVIKIHTNKKRNNSGRLRIYNNTSIDSHGHSYFSPSTMLGIRSGKLSFLSFVNGTLDDVSKSKESNVTDYRSLGYTQRRTAYDTKRRKDFSASANLTYDVTDKDRLGVWARYYHPENKSESRAYLSEIRTDTVSGRETTRGNGRSVSNQLTVSGNYTHTGEADEFSTSFTYIDNHTNSRSKQLSTYSGTTAADFSRQLLNDDCESGRTYKWRADYYYRFRDQKDKWEVGAAYTLWNQNNLAAAARLIDGVPDAYGNYDDHYRYREQITAAYTSYDWKVDAQWNIKAGVRVEHLVTDPESSLMGEKHDWKRHYTNWFPHAAVNWMINKKLGHILNINYTRGINRPSLSLLNPALLWNSEYNYSVGNPLLKPTYTHKIGLRNTLFERYTWNVSYSSGSTTSYKYYDVEGTNITYSSPFIIAIGKR